MTAPRTRLAPAVLALLLLAALLPTAAAGPVPQTEAALRHVVKDTLREADHAGAQLVREAHALAPSPLLPLPDRSGGLETLALFTQPAVRGADDLLAAAWIAPTKASWSGVYWIESEAGVVTPRSLTVGADGALLTLYGGSLAVTDAVQVSFRFLGPNGTVWSLDAPTLDVLDATPVRERVDFGGAVATSHGRAGLPELVLFSPWNVLGHDARMGFTLARADGTPVATAVVGGCADPADETSEAGCRPLYLAMRSDAETLSVWSGAPSEEGGVALRIEDLESGPYVFDPAKP